MFVQVFCLWGNLSDFMKLRSLNICSQLINLRCCTADIPEQPLIVRVRLILHPQWSDSAHRLEKLCFFPMNVKILTLSLERPSVWETKIRMCVRRGKLRSDHDLSVSACFSLCQSGSQRQEQDANAYSASGERLSVPAQTCGSSGWEQLCRATKSHRVPRELPGVLFHEQLQLLKRFFHVSVSERRMMKGCLLSPLVLSLHSSHSFPSQWFLIAIMWPNIWTWINK